MTTIHCLREECTYNEKGICRVVDIVVGKDMECKTGEEKKISSAKKTLTSYALLGSAFKGE